jgi:hypothetical protein
MPVDVLPQDMTDPVRAQVGPDRPASGAMPASRRGIRLPEPGAIADDHDRGVLAPIH